MRFKLKYKIKLSIIILILIFDVCICSYIPGYNNILLFIIFIIINIYNAQVF